MAGQGTQNRHTKANPAPSGTKEPSLFLRFRETPYYGGHRLSIQVTKTKGEHTTWVFAKAGLDNETSTMCKHQQQFGLDVQFSALVHNFNNIFV
jgi:hypothetical protein